MQLITLALGTRTAAAVRTGPDRAIVPGGAAAPSWPDVGALLAAGGLDAGTVPGGEEVTFGPEMLRRPVLQPGGVFCIGLNYRAHILEMGRALPEHPTVFSKLARALTDPYADLEVPKAGAGRLDYEGELGVVIGRTGRDIARENAHEYVAGYTVVNDMTARDYQERTAQWFAGKTWQELTPVGPAVVTPDEVGDLATRELLVTVDGRVRQRASLGDLVFDVPDLISDLSRIVELRPGDLIATGTPGGVGDKMVPPGYLTHGQTVEVTITGVGTLANTVRIGGS